MKKLFNKKNNYYFTIFMFLSLIGYVGEFYYSLIIRNKIVNPGFLAGPYCPIYGYGALIMILALNKFKKNNTKLFLSSVIIFTIFEYITSFLLEQFFGVILWDYTGFFLNINGRICFVQSILWGIMGILFIKKIEPCLRKVYKKIESKILNIIVSIFYVIMLIDTIYSIVILLG